MLGFNGAYYIVYRLLQSAEYSHQRDCKPRVAIKFVQFILIHKLYLYYVKKVYICIVICT